MSRDGRSRDALRAALARTTSKQPVGDGVRIPILSSWRRSMAAGLDPGSFAVPYRPDFEPVEPLLRAAEPILKRVADQLEGTGASLILTDPTGTVQHRWAAERPLMARLDAISIAPGFGYGEEQVGTNAIGTALAQGLPSLVHAAEHFADELTNMTCAATPVIDPIDGKLLAVVDLTSLARDAHPLMMTLAKQTAWEIERELASAVHHPKDTAELTATERTVAQLVGAGLTNKAVARRLFVSPHTVDTHLRHIYAKLGLESRVQLARWLADRAPLDAGDHAEYHANT